MKLKTFLAALAAVVLTFFAFPAMAKTMVPIGEPILCKTGEPFRINYSQLPIEAAFPGPLMAKEIKGIAGSYNQGFLDYLEEKSLWGYSTTMHKFIINALVPGSGKEWDISDTGPTTAPTMLAEDGQSLAGLLENNNVVATHDKSVLPDHRRIILPEYSGNNKQYVIADTAVESDDCLIVVWYSGNEQPYNGMSSVQFVKNR